MVQRDYIMRLIEQLGPLSAALVRSAEERKGHQYRQAGKTLDEALRRFFGLSAETARALSADELIALTRLGSPPNQEDGVAEKLSLLAALLREGSELDAAQGDPEGSADWALKALQIFLTVLVEEDPADGRAAGALGPLLDRLAGYDLPPAVKEGLWRYHEGRGDFASAEDWLFRLLDDDPAALVDGLAFYDRLAAQDDAALARGNLPRDEVAAGRAELRARLAEVEAAGS
jgi:hypothetical protein